METVQKMFLLNDDQSHTYKQYEDDLSKLPSKDFKRLHTKLIDLLYDFQTAEVEVDIQGIRTHLAMSNFPSYAVNESDVHKEVCRLKNAPYKRYCEGLASFKKDLEETKHRLLISRDKIFNELLTIYARFALAEEVPYEAFYQQVERLLESDEVEKVIKLESYL
jgi:hypothetical protein